MSIDFAEIRQKLIDNILPLCRELVPGGKVSGDYWIGRNPTRADKHAGSFWVRIKQPAIGAWRDEAGIRGVDDGDVVKLVQYCRHLPDLKETRRECLKLLGLTSQGGQAYSPAEIEERARIRAAERAKEDKDEADRRAKNARSAFALWLKAQEFTPATFPGSLIDRYFRSRAIDLVGGLLAKGRPLPGAIRFFPDHDYITLDGEILSFPCMITLMSGPDGKPRAIHRTWLAPDGSGKAELPDPKHNKPRKIWPAGWQGSVIRISKGAGNVTPEQAVRKGLPTLPLIITEGIEDALPCALALPDRLVWAAGTLGNLGLVPIDHPRVGSVIVCADNDWGKPQAQQSFEAGLEALRRHGKPVFVARSPKGKDMNDLLKGEKI